MKTSKFRTEDSNLTILTDSNRSQSNKKHYCIYVKEQKEWIKIRLSE